MIRNTLLLFDIDGTLLFSNYIDSKCFAQAFEERYKIKFPSIDWNYFPHVTDHTIFREGFRETQGEYPSTEEIEKFTDVFVEKIIAARAKEPEAFQMVPGARKLFGYLREKSLPFGIATGGWKAPATIKLKHVNLHSSDLQLSAADNQHSRQDILSHAIKICNGSEKQWNKVVYIGDAKWDVETCQKMHIPMVGIRKDGDHYVLKELGVKHILSNYEPLPAFFEAIKGAEVPG